MVSVDVKHHVYLLTSTDTQRTVKRTGSPGRSPRLSPELIRALHHWSEHSFSWQHVCSAVSEMQNAVSRHTRWPVTHSGLRSAVSRCEHVTLVSSH